MLRCPRNLLGRGEGSRDDVCRGPRVLSANGRADTILRGACVGYILLILSTLFQVSSQMEKETQYSVPLLLSACLNPHQPRSVPLAFRSKQRVHPLHFDVIEQHPFRENLLANAALVVTTTINNRTAGRTTLNTWPHAYPAQGKLTVEGNRKESVFAVLPPSNLQICSTHSVIQDTGRCREVALHFCNVRHRGCGPFRNRRWYQLSCLDSF